MIRALCLCLDGRERFLSPACQGSIEKKVISCVLTSQVSSSYELSLSSCYLVGRYAGFMSLLCVYQDGMAWCSCSRTAIHTCQRWKSPKGGRQFLLIRGTQATPPALLLCLPHPPDCAVIVFIDPLSITFHKVVIVTCTGEKLESLLFNDLSIFIVMQRYYKRRASFF